MKYKKKYREKAYYREYMRLRRKEGKDEYQFRNQKLTQYRNEMKEKAIKYKGDKCSICDQKFDAVCYDFHHLNPKEKDISPSVIFYKPWRIIKRVIDKCILVCSNCHRIIHKEDNYSHLQKTSEITINIQLDLFTSQVEN